LFAPGEESEEEEPLPRSTGSREVVIVTEDAGSQPRGGAEAGADDAKKLFSSSSPSSAATRLQIFRQVALRAANTDDALDRRNAGPDDAACVSRLGLPQRSAKRTPHPRGEVLGCDRAPLRSHQAQVVGFDQSDELRPVDCERATE